MPILNFFMGNKKRIVINANKQQTMLNQITVLAQNIREKQRRRSEYLKELERNNSEKYSASLKDKIVDGVSSFISYFMPDFLKRQNNINLRITETDKEIDESKNEMEIITNELLLASTNEEDVELELELEPIQELELEPEPIQELKLEPVPIQELELEPVPIQELELEPVPIQELELESVPIQELKLEPVVLEEPVPVKRSFLQRLTANKGN